MNSYALARQIRIDVLQMTSDGGSSHIGSCLSIADILAVLYSSVLKFKSGIPKASDRDIFLLSKGHAGAALYSTLANVGFFDRDLLRHHYQNGSKFSGHVSHIGIPGVELSTGSLGHGLSVGAGYALGIKKNKQNRRVYVLMSDGELNEGSVWEPIMLAAHHKLNNLIAIVDKNSLQSMSTTKETLDLGDLVDKFSCFGWDAIEIDGHDHHDLYKALDVKESKAPLAVIANTIKGKGISFMEGSVLWHYRTAKGDEFSDAMKELRDSN